MRPGGTAGETAVRGLRRIAAAARAAPGRGAGTVAAALLVGLGTGCAKEEPPPGALPDQRPPGIREIVPAPGSVVPDFDGELRVRLDEPVQFSATYGSQMEASPAYRYRVSTGFSDIRVRPEEGWRPGVVYVLRLPGGFSDLLGNRREEPIEVVFSTGPDVTDTRISGRIRDRVTGESVRGARLLVLPEAGDSVPYTAVSDTGGVVSLRALPPGRYTAYGFEDLNGNLSLDRRLEPHDSAAVRLEGASATAELLLRMVPPDSTPPALVRAEAADSVTAVLVFDDPLDPEQDLAAAEVVVRPSGEPTPLPVERIGLTRPPAPRPAAPADTLPGDTAAPDTLPEDPLADDTLPRDTVADDTLQGPADTLPRPAAAAYTAAADTAAPLPSDSLFLRLGRPLEAGRTYRASAAGLANLRGLTGGGDTTFVYTPPDTAAADGEPPADTAGAEGGAPADSAAGGQLPPDTAAEAPPDSTGRRR